MNNNRFQIRKTNEMGLKKVSKLIEKINVLHDSLLSIDEEISSIEKDLLLNYIRQLYEQVLEIGTEDKPLQSPSIVKEVIDLPVQEAAPIEREPVKKVPVEQPITEDKVADIATKVAPLEQETAEIAVEESSHAKTELSMEGLNSELVEMFEIKEAKELSEKLSSMPIKDLSTAMGINDRFLIVNELFNGDNAAFKDCVEHINSLDSYEEAKSYLLTNAAQKYDWSAVEKLKKAAGFISLVQRRFR